MDSETHPSLSCRLLPWRHPWVGSLMLSCTQLLLSLAPGYLGCDGINKSFPTSHLWTTLNWISFISCCTPKFATNSSNLFSILNCVCVCVPMHMDSGVYPSHIHIYTHYALVSLWRINLLKPFDFVKAEAGR